MKNFQKLTIATTFLALGACSGPALDAQFVEACVPMMEKIEEVQSTKAQAFCGCAAEKFTKHTTKAEFETIIQIFKDNADKDDGRGIESDLKTKLGETRYDEIGDHIDICD